MDDAHHHDNAYHDSLDESPSPALVQMLTDVYPPPSPIPIEEGTDNDRVGEEQPVPGQVQHACTYRWRIGSLKALVAPPPRTPGAPQRHPPAATPRAGVHALCALGGSPCRPVLDMRIKRASVHTRQSTCWRRSTPRRRRDGRRADRFPPLLGYATCLTVASPARNHARHRAIGPRYLSKQSLVL